MKLDDILDVMKVSKIWNLLDVHNLATEYIFNHSDYDVFIKSLYYLLNQDLLLNGFEVQVRKLLEKHNRIYHFIFDDTFLECSSSIVTEVLKSNEIEISEIYLLERLIVWVSYDKLTSRPNIKMENLKKSFKNHFNLYVAEF